MPPNLPPPRQSRLYSVKTATGAVLAVSALFALYTGVAGMAVMRDAVQGLQVQMPPVDGTSGGQDPQAAAGLPFETLAIQTDLGPSEAWLVAAPFRPGAPQPHQAAIFVHDRHGTRGDGYRYLPALQAAGIPALLISLRDDANAPASPDGQFTYGLTEWRDIDAALLALRDRRFSDVIVLADGTGAALVGQALLHSAEAARISAVALDSPVQDFDSVLAGIARQQGWLLPGVVAGAAGLGLRLTQPLDLDLARATPPLAAFQGPLLLASATDGPAPAANGSARLIQQRADAGLADLTLTAPSDPATVAPALARFLALANRP